MAVDNNGINQELYDYLNERYSGENSSITLVDNYYVCENGTETAYIPAKYLDPNYQGKINIYAYMPGDSGGGANTANQYAQQEIGLGDCAYFVAKNYASQINGNDVVSSATGFANAGNLDIRVLFADSFSGGGGRMAEALSNNTYALETAGHPEVALMWEDAYVSGSKETNSGYSVPTYYIDENAVYSELARYGVKFYGVRYNGGGSVRSSGQMTDPLGGFESISSYLGNGVLILTNNHAHGSSNGDLGNGGKLDESYNNGLQRYIMGLENNLGGTYNYSGVQKSSDYQFSGWNTETGNYNLYLNPENIRLNGLSKDDIGNLSLSVTTNKVFNYSTFGTDGILTNNQERVVGDMNSLVNVINSIETVNVTGVFDPTGLMAVISSYTARYNSLVESLMSKLYNFAKYIVEASINIGEIDDQAAEEAEGLQDGENPPKATPPLVPPAETVPDGGIKQPEDNGEQQANIIFEENDQINRKSPDTHGGYINGDTVDYIEEEPTDKHAKEESQTEGTSEKDDDQVPPASEPAPSPSPSPKIPPSAPSEPSAETNSSPDPIIMQAFSESNERKPTTEQDLDNVLNFSRGDGSNLYATMDNGHLSNVKFIYPIDELSDPNSNLESIKQLYGNADYVQDIIINNNNVEVILKEDAYANITTFDELISKYKLDINFIEY